MARRRQVGRRTTRCEILVALLVLASCCWVPSAEAASSPKKRVYAVEYSTINQLGNNILNAAWGSAGSALVNDAPSSFSASGSPWPGPPARSLANALSRPILQYNTGITAVVPAWWDFIWGDIVYLQLAGAPAPIAVPPDDPLFAGSNKQIPFTRAADSFGRVTNLVTSYIDASTVYGSDAVRALALTNQTNIAFLAVSSVSGSAGPLPPRNSLGSFDVETVYANADPTKLFLTGGQRANESPQLLSLHTLFVREHNRRAAAIYASFSDFETPDIAFSEARRFVIATIQRITYYEFLPVLLGAPLPTYTGYDPTINATPTLLFTHVAMVVYRSQFNSAVIRIDSESVAQPLSLRDCLYNPDPCIDGDIDSILLGLVAQNPLRIDPFYVSELRNIVASATTIQDFLASDIQRGRDLGLPFYNDARQFYGLSRLSSFSDITSDQTLAATLASIYNNNIDQVDVLVGGLAEDPASPSLVGPLFKAVLQSGFTKLRDGDRFYFESKFAAFTIPELAAFTNVTLSSVVLDNTASIPSYPCNAFLSNSSAPVCLKPVSIQQVPSSSSNGAGPIFPLDGFTSLLDGLIELYFNVTSDGVLNVVIRGKTTGWVGFGLARETGTMIGSDVWIGWVSNGQVTLADYQISARIPGCPGVCEDINSGGFESLFNKAGAESNGWTTLQYSRKLDTGDSIDVVISQGEAVPVVYALGESDVLQYHGGNRGAAIINFFTNQTTVVNTAVDSANNRLTVHGVMMFMAWAVMFPIGLYAVRILKYIRKLREWWFHIHLIVQYLGVLFMITGFALAIEAVPALGHSHFSSTHARMGMAAVVLGVVVPATGQLTAVFWTATPKRWQIAICGIRLFPDMVHFVTGYLSPIFGFITLYWGLYQRGAGWYWYMLLSFWITFVSVVFFGSFILQQIYTYYENKRSAQEGGSASKSQASAQNDDEDWDS